MQTEEAIGQWGWRAGGQRGPYVVAKGGPSLAALPFGVLVQPFIRLRADGLLRIGKERRGSSQETSRSQRVRGFQVSQVSTSESYSGGKRTRRRVALSHIEA
jgi:hypothetical protein